MTAPFRRFARTILVLGALLHGACSSPPLTYAGCEDTECKTAWVLAHWEAERDAVADAVAAEPDPLVRVVLVRVLTQSHPGELADLCGKLPAGPSTDQCRTMNSRPHLSTGRPAATQASDRRLSLAPSGEARLFAAVPAVDAPCPAAPAVCQAEEARKRILAADEAGAAAACNALEAGTPRSECYFQAAEALMEKGQVPNATLATRMCLASERFGSNCLLHLVRGLARLAPRAARVEPDVWKPVSVAIDEAVRATEAEEPALASDLRAVAWAYALRASYSLDDTVTGAPFDALPVELAPLIRGGAAARFYAIHAQEVWTLEQWRDGLATALADRSPRPSPDRTRVVEPRLFELWQSRLPGEDTVATVAWFGNTERPTSADPATDGLLALLMAAASAEPPGLELLQAAAADDDRVVRFTAAILLSEVHPMSDAMRALTRDTDALVRARARGNRGGRP